MDGSLTAAISTLVLEDWTSRGALLPQRARVRYRMAVDRLRDAAGLEDWELELDVGEAERRPRGREEGERRRRAREDSERLLWAVRWEVARGSVG